MTLHFTCSKCKKIDICSNENAKNWECPHCILALEENDLTREDLELLIYTLKYDVRNDEDYSDVIRKLKKMWKALE